MAPRALIYGVAVGAALFHLYAAGVSPFTALVQRPVHLALMSILGFVGIGVGTWRRRAAVEGRDGAAVPPRKVVKYVVTAVLVGAVLFSCGYLVFQHETLVPVRLPYSWCWSSPVVPPDGGW
jgi:hypothetical protein